MANATLKDLFGRFWQHIVAALGTKADAEVCNNIKTKVESYENDITFEITYEDGDGNTNTKKIKVLGVEVSE